MNFEFRVFSLSIETTIWIDLEYHRQNMLEFLQTTKFVFTNSWEKCMFCTKYHTNSWENQQKSIWDYLIANITMPQWPNIEFWTNACSVDSMIWWNYVWTIESMCRGWFNKTFNHRKISRFHPKNCNINKTLDSFFINKSGRHVACNKKK